MAICRRTKTTSALLTDHVAHRLGATSVGGPDSFPRARDRADYRDAGRFGFAHYGPARLSLRRIERRSRERRAVRVKPDSFVGMIVG